MTANEKAGVLSQNLCELSRREELTKRQKLLTAKELTEELSLFESDPTKIFADFSKISRSEYSPSPAELLAVCEAIASSSLKKHVRDVVFIGSNEATPAGAHSRISFVKNRFNELAYEKFARLLSSPKPEYAQEFSESCENVIDGQSEFCILPISSTTDGRMRSFYSMLDRYELKICSATEIEDDSSATSVKYALIGRACKEPNEKAEKREKTEKSKHEKCIFEFSIISPDGEFLPSLLSVAALSSATTLSIDSLPVEYASHLQRFFLSFSLPTQSALAFRLYVALSHQSYTPIGFYKTIK